MWTARTRTETVSRHPHTSFFNVGYWLLQHDHWSSIQGTNTVNFPLYSFMLQEPTTGPLGRILLLRTNHGRDPGRPVHHEQFHRRLRVLERGVAVQRADLDDPGVAVRLRLAPERRATVAAEKRGDRLAAVGRLGEFFRSALGH